MSLIYDTTLRDGEQMPGVVFTSSQKIELAKKIDAFGTDIIGFMPAVSREEREIVSYLVGEGLQDKIIAATMLKKEHVDIASDCGVKNIILFTSLSDIHLDKKLKISREENLKNSLEYVNYSREKGFNVFFAGEDSSRADFSYLVNFMNSFGDKVDYFLPCDTMGFLTPFQTYNFVHNLKKECDVKIGLHVHNDFGCATANTLAGLEAGADLFSGTFTGIGERAGNACLEEIILSLKYQYGKEFSLDYSVMGDICDLVEKYSGVVLQKHKPIVGKNAFSHESGIHVDGLLKCLENYEVINPELIGKNREILFGKHSGIACLKYLFGDKFEKEEYGKILLEIKQLASEKKKSFSEKEVLEMYRTI